MSEAAIAFLAGSTNWVALSSSCLLPSPVTPPRIGKKTSPIRYGVRLSIRSVKAAPPRPPARSAMLTATSYCSPVRLRSGLSRAK